VNDNFNLYGLSHTVNHYTNALKLVRGQYDDHVTADLQQQAEILYGLIHSRYIITFTGVREMMPHYKRSLFGTCPRVACRDHPLLPIGLRPESGEMTVRTFCPSCQDIYNTDCQLDGSCFGPYFAQFFVQAMGNDAKIGAFAPTKSTVCGVPVGPAATFTRCVHG
jgi:casein kinase II subunit beta